MNNRETFIILHRRLKMGGIETGSVEMMKNALSHNKRTIWVGNVDKVYDKNFGDVIDNPNIFSLYIFYNFFYLFFCFYKQVILINVLGTALN